MNINDLISGLAGTNNPSNGLVALNSAEETGNSDDLLFRTEQPALGIGIAGGTTLTNISPVNAINDLASGKLSLAAIVWLAIAGIFLYWVVKK